MIRLNRGYDRDGRVRVRPRIVMLVPGWDDRLLADIGDSDVSIENSVAFDARTGVAYFTNSGGLVQGWDIRDVLRGGTRYRRVLRFWAGDSTDASVVIDPQGYLYVGRKKEKNVPRPSSYPRERQIGSLMKLDPFHARALQGDGLRHGHRGRAGRGEPADRPGGVAHPAARPDVDVAGPRRRSAHRRRLHGRAARLRHRGPGRQAPGTLARPARGCIESTPAVWHGKIFVGTRGGAIYGIGE